MEVLAANDIVDIVGARVTLKPAGAGRLKGLCPFHTEKTPSFTVNRARQMYHCFGCGKGGDALDFLQEQEGLSFVDALKKLADRGSVRLPALSERDNAAEYLREQMFKFGQFAMTHFRKELAEPLRGSAGRQYVQSRQLKETTVQRFGLGYAPDGWTYLLDAARAHGFPDPVLQECGLFRSGDRGGLYDFFRHRVMFPIKDISGHVVAFGGRDLAGSNAKYINSPETPVYRKSRVLYGLFEARDAMRREKRVLLVEGYFDLLRCFDAGIEHVVASCGTALTAEQAALLRRYVPEVVVVYDGDAAGIHAALRGTGILSAAGLTVRAMALPDGQDPDDFIRSRGPEAFLEALDRAEDWVTFYVRMSADRTATIEGRTKIAQEVFDIVRQIEDEIRADEYLKRLAQELRLNEHICRTEYQKFRQKAERRPLAATATPEQDAAPVFSREDREFLAAVLRHPELLEEVRAALAEAPLPAGPLSTVISGLLEKTGRPSDLRLEDNAARQLLAAAAAEDDSEETRDPCDQVRKRLNRIRRQAMEARSAQVLRELQEAERQGDMERAKALCIEQIRLQSLREKVGAA